MSRRGKVQRADKEVGEKVPLVSKKGILVIMLLGVLVVATAMAWPNLAPQLFVTIIGVSVGVVAADIFLIRREARLAFRSILSDPSARDFLDGWHDFRKLLNDASHWWGEHHETVAGDAETLLHFLHRWAERLREKDLSRERQGKSDKHAAS